MVALSPVSPSLAPATNYDRINAAITEAAKVSAKQDAFDLAGLLTSVSQRVLQADFAALVTTINGKASAATVTALQNTVAAKANQSAVDTLTNSVASLSQALAGKIGQTAFDNLVSTVNGKAAQSALNDLRDLLFCINAGVYPSERPGDTPTAFTASRAGGDPGALAPLDTSLYPIRAVADGLGVEVTNSREVWERTLHAVESGQLWRARWRYLRTRLAQDPQGDAIALLIQWYTASKGLLGNPVTFYSNAPALNAVNERIGFVGLPGVTGVDPLLERPIGGVYFRLGYKAFGNEALSVLTGLRAVDVSDIDDAIKRLVPDDALPNLSARIDELIADLSAEEMARRAEDLALDQEIGAVDVASQARDTVLGTLIGTVDQGSKDRDTALDGKIGIVDVKTDRALVSSTIQSTVGRPLLGDSYTSAVGAKRWGVGTVVDRPRRAVSFRARGTGFNAVASLLVRVISRGRADADLNVASPGGASADIETFNRTFPIAALGLDGTLMGAQDFTVPLAGMPDLSPRRIYFLDWTALAANGSPVAIGCAAGTSQEALTPHWSRGYFQLLNNNFSVMPGDGNQTVFFDLLTEAGVVQEDADFVRRDVAGRAASGDDYSAGAAFFTGWGFGVETARRTVPARLHMRSDGLSALASIRLRVRQRPQGQEDIGSGTMPGQAASDRLLATITTPIAETGADSASAAWQDYALPLDAVPELRPGFVHYFEVEGLKADGTVGYLGTATGTPVSSPTPTYNRGYYMVGANKVALDALGGVTVLYRLEERESVRGALRKVVAGQEGRPAYGPPSLDRAVIYDDPLVADQAMPTLRVPRMRLRTAKGDLLIPAQPIVCQPIATDAVTDTAVTITFNGRAFLRRQYISAISAKRTADNVALVLGVDYQINANTGRIYGLKDIAPFVATVTCTGRKHRYDLIYVDPSNGRCDIAAGQIRAWEPEEYRPACPDGMIPLFSVYVYGIDPVHRAEMIPVCEYDGLVRLDEAAETMRLMDYNRRALARVLGKCARGGKVYVANYSDSIRTLGGSAQNQLIPNFDRDLIGWYAPRYEQDTLDSIQPRFSNEYGGPGSNLHVYVGDMWFLLRALEARYPQASIDYLNFGVGGTTTAATLSGGLYNARHPDRLNALFGISPAGPKPDLVVLGFGTNELGSSTTYANTRALIQRAKTEGADVLVTTPPRFNAWDPVSSIEAWRFTTDALIRAARDEGVAYLSFDRIEGPGREGAVGLSAKTAGQTGAYNHPGRAQEAGHGCLLASLVGGPGIDLPITRNGYSGQSLAPYPGSDQSLAALNGLDRRVLSLAADPGTGDIAAGTARVAKNTATGRISLWVNDGGTMRDLLTFTPASS